LPRRGDGLTLDIEGEHTSFFARQLREKMRVVSISCRSIDGDISGKEPLAQEGVGEFNSAEHSRPR
jgi:hypothetical protein